MTEIQYRLPQVRRVGQLPGPKSRELAARRVKVVAGAVVSGVSIYAEDASGGVIQDVDGNSLIDLDSGIAVMSGGFGFCCGFRGG